MRSGGSRCARTRCRLPWRRALIEAMHLGRLQVGSVVAIHVRANLVHPASSSGDSSIVPAHPFTFQSATLACTMAFQPGVSLIERLCPCWVSRPGLQILFSHESRCNPSRVVDDRLPLAGRRITRGYADRREQPPPSSCLSHRAPTQLNGWSTEWCAIARRQGQFDGSAASSRRAHGLEPQRRTRAVRSGCPIDSSSLSGRQIAWGVHERAVAAMERWGKSS